MRFFFQSLLLFCCFLVPSTVVAGETTLETLQESFSHSKSNHNSVCILHDGWRIAFLSHNGKQVGAAIIMEEKGADEHEHDLNDTVSRVAELVGMSTPESMNFEEEDQPSALLVDQDVLGELAEDVKHVFDGSPLAAIAYLIGDEYFCIHSIQPNGFIHWKTIKKSGVELMMPVASGKLTAIEVTGRQQMNEYAAEVLADKLGLGKNNVPGNTRASLCSQFRCSVVPYMNTKDSVVMARTDRRIVIGKRQAVPQFMANRNEGALSFPSKASDWPEEEEEEEEKEDEEEDKEDSETTSQEQQNPSLTPEKAREAYIQLIRSI